VNLRDQRRCAHLKRDGSRCNQSRWIELHHKIPVSAGGLNTAENLITLCSTHHKFAHL
jgi:5-methylcytosine-specific restriction endonuclease McrA